MSTLKIEERRLITTLTPEEQRVKGKELAELSLKIRQAEDDESARKKAIKENIDGLKAGVSSLSTVVKECQEWRDVKVSSELEGETVREVRMDTGAIVLTRPATKQELQQKFEMQIDSATTGHGEVED